ncbi:MAG: hypothetical protein EOM73_13190, partial [Bacteroidia bacterium]|nr:hypothetical protein [Bacteroidia bacterium]
MQKLNRQLSSISAGDIIRMTSPACLCPDSHLLPLPLFTEPTLFNEGSLRETQALPYLVRSGEALSTIPDAAVVIDDAGAGEEEIGENIISVAVQALCDDDVSFIYKDDVAWTHGAGLRFSVEGSLEEQK